MNRQFTHLSLLFALLVGALAPLEMPPGRLSAEGQFSEGLTFEKSVLVPEGGLPVGETSGEIRVTLTEDRTAVLRAELIQLRKHFPLPEGDPPLILGGDGAVYYAPPVHIVDGRFIVKAAGTQIGGMIVSETEISVQVNICFSDTECNTSPPLAVWTLVGPINPPSHVGDTKYGAHIENGSGRLVILTNAEGEVTALDVNGLSFGRCFNPPLVFTVSMYFDPPRSIHYGSASGFVAVGDRGQFQLNVQDMQLIDGILSGSANVYYWPRPDPDCAETISWTTAPATPQAEPTSTIAPALPPAGSGPSTDRSPPITLLAALVIASALFVAFSLARKRADQDN